jgi:signal transduction histidine kinase
MTQPAKIAPTELASGLNRQIGRVGYGVAAGFFAVVAVMEMALPGAEHLPVRLAALAVLVAVGATVAVRVVQRVARAHVAGLERARLAGVRLAARTAQHELNNSLALTLGNAEMLAEHPDLPTDLRVLADQSLRGAQLAADAVDRLVRVDRVRERDWGPLLGSTIDLGRAAD